MSIVARCILFCVALLALPGITVSADLDGNVAFIEVNAGLLSVKLEKAALSEVLRTVGEQARVRVTTYGDLGNVQPQTFSGATLPEGIKSLAQNTNADLVMIYNKDKAGLRYLTEIRAYEENRNKLSGPPRVSAPTPLPIPVPAGF